jgi:hypothetical protein
MNKPFSNVGAPLDRFPPRWEARRREEKVQGKETVGLRSLGHRLLGNDERPAPRATDVIDLRPHGSQSKSLVYR